MSNVIARETLYCNKCTNWKPETDFSEIGRAQARAEDENAMCQDCVNRLYKGRLGRDEISGYIKEDRERMLQRTRNPLLEKMVGEGRIGAVMHHSEFILKLQRITPCVVVGPGFYKEDLSLYRVLGDQVDFLCWIAAGTMQEFSTVLFNRDRQPIAEIRGWRTALLRMIKFGLLTEEQVKKEFGNPSSPQQALFWNQELWINRNHRIEPKG